jgi:hypothetical protein
VETCTRTVHGRPLLRPGPDANERIVGVLGRAAEYYGIDLYGFGFTSNHYHMLYDTKHGLQMSRFQGHLNSNVARELGRLHDWREKFWARRYRPMMISDEREAQRQRLKYVLAAGTKEGLVERPHDWPGPNAARALVDGEPVVGYWFNRTEEYYARRQGIELGKYDFATRYVIELKPLPAFKDDSPEEYRAMIAAILLEIEEEAAVERKGRPVLGVEKVLAQDPCERLGKSKKSPAPMLFFAERPETRDAMSDDYKDFVDAYEIAAQHLIEAAEQGQRLDPRRHFPGGSFPPSVIEEILRTAGVFNPEAEFPARSFPRPWPFVGGQLGPPPPDPPSRQLVFDKIDGKQTIVWRGEIPSVHVPRRLHLEIHQDATTTPTNYDPPEEVPAACRDPARDPP